MREVVILGAARTIGGQFGGSLQDLSAPELGAAVVRESIKRSGISPEVVEETIFGNAWQAGAGPNVARLSSVMGGIPVDAPAVTVNVRCGSSIQGFDSGDPGHQGRRCGLRCWLAELKARVGSHMRCRGRAGATAWAMANSST